MQISRTKTRRDPTIVKSDERVGYHTRRCEVTYVDRFESKIDNSYDGFLSITLANAIKIRYGLIDIPRSVEYHEVVLCDNRIAITFVDRFVIVVPDGVDFTATTEASLCDRWGAHSMRALPGTAVFYEDLDPGIVSGEIQLSTSNSSDFRSDEQPDEVTNEQIVSETKEMIAMLRSMKSIL